MKDPMEQPNRQTQAKAIALDSKTSGHEKRLKSLRWFAWICFAVLILMLLTTIASAQEETTTGATDETAAVQDIEKAEAAASIEEPEDEPADSDSELRSEREGNVGYPSRIDQIVIPGSELVPINIVDRKQPMILRVVETFPHGDHFRYNLEYTGLEPGTYNLIDYLKRSDNTDVSDLPEIMVTINSVLPEGQTLPADLPAVKSRYNHFYLAMLVLGGALWLAGLLAILFARTGREKRPEAKHTTVTVADRLKPLIDQAIAGELRTPEAAELERVLNAFWSKKLRLQHLTADQLRKKLRQHTDASKLLNAMDHWLHRPDADPNVDVAALLQPYQSDDYQDL